jgi:hypothetical protein
MATTVPSSGPAAAPAVLTTLVAPKSTFDEAYSLSEGEVARRIIPPFPADRLERALPTRPGQNAGRRGPAVPGDARDYGSAVFHWTEPGKLEWAGFSPGQPTVAGVLRECLDLSRFEIDLPDDLRREAVPGDWVLRRPSTFEDRLAALAPVLASLPKPVRLERRRVEREVVVVRGSYQFKPLPGAPDAKLVHVGPGDVTRPPTDDGIARSPIRRISGAAVAVSGGGGYGSLSAFFRKLADRIDQPVVDETIDGARRIGWQDHGGKADDHDDGRDSLLDNASRQTGLRFAREVRGMDVWTATGQP